MASKIWLAAFFLISWPLQVTGQVLKHEVVKISEGVYSVIFDLVPGLPVDGNSTIIINDDDVLVVDTNITPSSARAVIAEIRKLTNKPVRYVVNTHHHGDHIYGNRVYQETFQQVEIIGRAKMREDFLKLNPSGRQEGIEEGRKLLAEAPERLRTGKKENGEVMTEQEIAALKQRFEMMQKYLPEIEQAPLIPPTLTVENETTLYRGQRQIKLLYLGRGNTQGDLVIYLPQEKVLITGDLLVYPLPFAFASYIGEWAQTMKKLRAIEADVIIPGHGPVQKNKDYLELVTELLEAAVKETQEAVRRGLSLEEAKKTIDLEALRVRFTGDDPRRNRGYKNVLVPLLAEQAYKEAETALKRK